MGRLSGLLWVLLMKAALVKAYVKEERAHLGDPDVTRQIAQNWGPDCK